MKKIAVLFVIVLLCTLIAQPSFARSRRSNSDLYVGLSHGSSGPSLGLDYVIGKRSDDKRWIIGGYAGLGNDNEGDYMDGFDKVTPDTVDHPTFGVYLGKEIFSGIFVAAGYAQDYSGFKGLLTMVKARVNPFKKSRVVNLFADVGMISFGKFKESVTLDGTYYDKNSKNNYCSLHARVGIMFRIGGAR